MSFNASRMWAFSRCCAGKAMAQKNEKEEAVKTAREEANSTEVEQKNIGERVMDHVFGDLRAPQA